VTKAEEIVIDRKTMREIIEFMEEAIKEGLSKDEIMSQIDLILDKEARKRIEKSERDIKEHRVKRFKTAEELLEDLCFPNNLFSPISRKTVIETRNRKESQNPIQSAL